MVRVGVGGAERVGSGRDRGAGRLLDVAGVAFDGVDEVGEVVGFAFGAGAGDEGVDAVGCGDAADVVAEAADVEGEAAGDGVLVGVDDHGRAAGVVAEVDVGEGAVAEVDDTGGGNAPAAGGGVGDVDGAAEGEGHSLAEFAGGDVDGEGLL